MSSRKWQVVKGPNQENVAVALFHPPQNLKLSLTLKEAGDIQAAPFMIEVDVFEIWAGNRKTGRKPRASWEGMHSFKGEVVSCPQLTKSSDPEVVTTVSVTYRMGSPVGELEVIGIE